jgi:hypothetical protein
VVKEIAEHVEEKASRSRTKDSNVEDQGNSPSGTGDTPVLCIAGRTELDRAAAEMLAQVIEEKGIGAKVLPPIAVTEGALGQLDLTGVKVVCLSYLHPQPQVFARYICRRLRRRSPNVKLIVCCWNALPQSGKAEDKVRQMAADAVVASLDACVGQVDSWVFHQVSSTDKAPPVPDNEHERLAALQELGLTSARGPRFDEVARRAAQTFGAPIGLVSLIDEEHQLWPGAAGLPPDLNATRQTRREESICGHVVATDGVLVAEDVTKDPRFSDNPLVLEKGIRFYAGAPLRTSSGLVLGSLCVIDTEPRQFSEEDRNRLQAMANELMAMIESEHSAKAEKTKPAPVSISG